MLGLSRRAVAGHGRACVERHTLTPTAGNVLFTGDLDGNFLALDARNGKTLYRFDTGGPIAGGIITYEAKGRQYVAVASGHSGGSIPLSGSTTIVIFGQRGHLSSSARACSGNGR